VDLKPSPQGITIFCSDPTDIDGKKRILIQGQDSTGQTVYTQDTWFQPQGEFVTFDTPFASSARQWNTITGLQKDQTNGYVQVFQTDPTTGAQVLLVTMEPSETVAGYRRYFFDRLPRDCCQGLGASATVQVTAIVKLDHIPVQQDTDYFLLTNLDAISAEAQSIRYGKMDTLQAKQMSVERHKKAIQLLIGELSHYQGIDTPAIQFRPFGSARLTRSHIRIGMT
jgi:hypothetical protein